MNSNFLSLAKALFEIFFMVSVLVCLPLGSFSQNRLEIPISDDEIPYDLIPLGDQFLLVHLVPEPGSNDLNQFNLDLYDSDFGKKDVIPVQVPQNFFMVGRDNADGQLFLVFQSNLGSELQVSRIDPKSSQVLTSRIELFKNLRIRDIEANGDFVWLSCLLKDQPVLFELDLIQQNRKTLPTGIGFKVETIHDLVFNDEEEILYYLLGLDLAKNKSISVRLLSPEGKVLEDIMVDPEPEFSVLDGRLFRMGNQLIVSGFYGTKKTPKPKGVYLVRITPGNSEIKYFDFKKIPGFYSYLTISHQMMIDQGGILENFKTTKVSPSNLVTNQENLLISEQGIMISLNSFSRNYRSRNEEERQAMNDNINFSVSQNPYGNQVVDDRQGDTGFTPNALDVVRLRHKDYAIRNLMETGFNYQFDAYLAFDSDLNLQWNLSIRFDDLGDRYAGMNTNLQKDSLLIIHKAEDPGLFAYRLNGPENLETLAEHQLVAKSNEKKRPCQGYLTRVEK